MRFERIHRIRTAWILLLLAHLGLAQPAIRLKTLSDRPGQSMPAPVALRGGRLPKAGHYILQFQSIPGTDARQNLAGRGLRVLQYVPEQALLVSAPAGADLNGLALAAVFKLEPAHKISPRLAETAQRVFLVMIHPDVDITHARDLLVQNGLALIDNPNLLPGHVLGTGNASAVPAVAALDEVAYIMPASADLVAGNPVMGCAGAVTEAGPVGDYVAVGSGWPPDSSGAVVLNYYFQSLTDKLSADVVQAEIERAFNEWQRYAKVTISPGGSADTARTLAIQFAHGAHGDNYPFDPAGQILAHTFYPAPVNPEPLAGDMHFNADEAWHTGGADIDLFSVALHETGHALGLGHSDQPGAVMYPYYRFASGLTDDDIAGIRFLYGSRDTQAVPQPPATPAPPTPTPPAPTPPSNPPVNPPAQPPAQGPDTTPPSLTITTPSSTIVSTSSASILVSGTAADNVGVTAVKFSNSVGDSGFASGTSSWSAQIDLLVGTNVITIRAYDAAGNSAWRSVTVVRH